MQKRIVKNFDEKWKFFYGDVKNANLPDFDDSKWRFIDIPHDFSIERPRKPDAPSGRDGGYFQTGAGWYRKKFKIPESYFDKKILIEFEGIYMNSEVWINGHSLGKRPNGYISFYYDLSPYLNYGKENLISVRVDNSKQPNSRWYSGSGIYRHVWLTKKEKVNISQWGIFITTPEVSEKFSKINIKTTVENSFEEKKSLVLKSTVVNPYGKIAVEKESRITLNGKKKQTISQNIIVNSPLLWSCNTPFLYTLISTIFVNNVKVDETKTTFGIRSIYFSSKDGFVLNGKPMKLKGGCIHHDNGPLGSCAYDSAEERKIKLLKENGFNAIRTAHNPPSPYLLHACDKLGMFVIDEAFDVWQEHKLHQDYATYFNRWWKKDLKDIIYRDRNHPSIIIWSIGNEIPENSKKKGVKLAEKLAETVRKLDPTRPVTSAVQPVENWEKTDRFFSKLDICGYNYMRSQYRKDHQKHPDRIMVATESFPYEAFEYWSDVLELPYLIGDFVWTGFDYLGEAAIGYSSFKGAKIPPAFSYPWHQAYCGDIDICGFKRPQSYYRDILWNKDKKVFIFVHHPDSIGKKKEISKWGWPSVYESWTWNGYEGRKMKVDIYSNCEEVELFINKKSLGIKKITWKNRFIASYILPYTPGCLKAIGYIKGKKISEHKLFTAEKPCSIILKPETNRIKAKKGNLCFIRCKIVDKNGIINAEAKNLIEFKISGEGKIVAVGSSNPYGNQNYTDTKIKAFLGKCLLIVKSNGKKGKITITARSENLKSSKINIIAE